MINVQIRYIADVLHTIFRFVEHSLHGNSVTDMESLENVMPANIPRVASFDAKHSSFSASREYDTVNIFRHESVNSLSPRCRGLTVCQCQRDKKKKTANEGVGPVFRYQAFFSTFILAKGKMPNYLNSVKYIFTLARQSMNFVNRIYSSPIPSNVLFKQFFLYGAQVPFVKSKYSLIDRRLS